MNTMQTIILSFQETKDILYRHLKLNSRDKDERLTELLNALILSFFCKINEFDQQDELFQLRNLLNREGFENFENTGISSELTDSIINTTLMHLPKFKSHEDSHCIQRERINIFNSPSVVITLDQQQLLRYL